MIIKVFPVITATVMTLSSMAVTADNSCDIDYRIADKSEGAEIIAENSDFYSSMSQTNIEWRIGAPDQTGEDMTEFAQEQVLDFTDEQKKGLSESMNRIQKRFDRIGFDYPLDEELVFVRTTMREQCGCMAYTMGNTIFIDEHLANWSIAKDYSGRENFDRIIIHEIFHVISRNDEDFRRKMYDVIGFELCDEIEVSDRINERIFLNPDAPELDSCAYFTIDGEKKKAAVSVIFTSSYIYDTDPRNEWQTVVIPADEPDKMYRAESVTDFYDVMGHNTSYTISPEECLAENFSDAVMYGMNKHYEDPQIIEDIIGILEDY